MSSVFEELTDADLEEALAGSRQRGQYDGNLMDYLTSGKRGVEVNLTDGTHAGKKPQSIKTGYTTARDKIVENKNNQYDEEVVEAAKATNVILKGDRVFLIRQAAGV